MYNNANEGKSHRYDAADDVSGQYAQIYREPQPGLYGFLGRLLYVDTKAVS